MLHPAAKASAQVQRPAQPSWRWQLMNCQARMLFLK